jgi:hypothetical protein
MKQTFIITLLLICLRAVAQQPTFSTQGEQEKYWAKKAFETEYVKQDIPRYNARVLVKGETYYFANQTVTLMSLSEDSRLLFSTGILYPAAIVGPCADSINESHVIGCDSIRISNVEELSFLNQSFKHKRFQFLLWRQKLLNPQLCFFELINENATPGMSLAEFIKGAHLTYYKPWSILI